MPHVLSLKPMTIRTLSGHTVSVEPRVPAYVAEAALQDALAAGCAECDAAGNVLISGEPFVVAPVADERLEGIKSAVTEILARNDPASVSSLTGMPKVPLVSDLCGFKVSLDEVREAFETLNAE